MAEGTRSPQGALPLERRRRSHGCGTEPGCLPSRPCQSTECGRCITKPSHVFAGGSPVSEEVSLRRTAELGGTPILSVTQSDEKLQSVPPCVTREETRDEIHTVSWESFLINTSK